MKFSIVTASYQAGDKLKKTLKNILQQTYEDYEVIVKDGGSNDGSIEALQADSFIATAIENRKIKLIIKKDKSVYEGMNQAIDACTGDYILFLNCGDSFHDAAVLKTVAEYIDDSPKSINSGQIFYGNTFCERTQAMVHSAPKITGFTCYRNIPCHQSCFYDRRLFQDKRYDLSFKIRADYDHFLYCFYEKKVEFHYMDIVVSDYEGGGISENKRNLVLDKQEHDEIINRYMSKTEIRKYKLLMAMTLAPLRRKIAENSAFSGMYHKMKDVIYRTK